MMRRALTRDRNNLPGGEPANDLAAHLLGCCSRERALFGGGIGTYRRVRFFPGMRLPRRDRWRRRHFDEVIVNSAAILFGSRRDYDCDFEDVAAFDFFSDLMKESRPYCLGDHVALNSF